MKRNFPLYAAALLAIVVAAPASAQVKSSGKLGLGIDVTGMDRSVRPQDDWFRFVNGAWFDKTEIPADQSSYGSFIILRDNAQTALKGIIDKLENQKNAPGSNEQKIADLYASFMDTARIQALGLKPLDPIFTVINGIKTNADLPVAFTKLGRMGVRGPLSAGVTPDPKNSSVYTVSVGQGGLTLPDRDYYLREDGKFPAIRKAYTDNITKLMTLANQPDPAGAAQRILALETQIAQKQWDRVKNRDRNATYNKMSLADFAGLAKNLDWKSPLLTQAPGITEVIVRQPDFVTSIDAIVANTPVSTWKEYLTFSTIETYSGFLPKAFDEADFEFGGKVLAGRQEQQARWKRGVNVTESVLGEPLGKLYIAQYFPPTAKARMDTLVKNLLAAFKVGIDSLEWMSPATKAAAQEKLAKYSVKIGYPERWRDYSALQIKPHDLIGDIMAARSFNSDESWGHLGKPVEKWRMNMTPQTVNANYSPTNNEITFPAGILQPPFFNVNADDATNYGAIGAVIGHEISHGFDDQGRKSDGNGNLRDWWTPEDAAAFQAKTDKLGAEYESYDPLPGSGVHINGKTTMGENIGDLSGLAVAYRAYHISLKGKEAPVIDGFTGDQRFFLGFGQIWRFKERDEALRNQMLTDPHSPGMYRSFVPLTNFDPWYAAWNVQPGDKLYRAPQDRVKIW